MDGPRTHMKTASWDCRTFIKDGAIVQVNLRIKEKMFDDKDEEINEGWSLVKFW